ncbi:hypothetical protein [Paenarthrobacter sp. NPDC089316]|uniref:hypothetical protein n=1 Tax=unclassified Paenarthrobacter TaxID=2634190 RepID=UPI00344A0ACB
MPSRQPATAQTQAASFLANLGLDGSRVAELATIRYDKRLTAANAAKFSASSEIDPDFYPAPVIKDGKFSPLATKIPLIVSSTLGEFASNHFKLAIPSATNPLDDAYRPNVSAARVQELLKQKYGSKTDDIVKAFRKGFPTHDLFDLLYVDGGANSFSATRLQVADAKAAQAAEGGAPVNVSEYAWNLPIFGGVTAHHTGGDLPLVLNNIDKVAYVFAGDRRNAERIADESSSGLISFLHYGDPGKLSKVSWPEYKQGQGATLVYDAPTHVRNNPDRDFQELLAAK